MENRRSAESLLHFQDPSLLGFVSFLPPPLLLHMLPLASAPYPLQESTISTCGSYFHPDMCRAEASWPKLTPEVGGACAKRLRCSSEPGPPLRFSQHFPKDALTLAASPQIHPNCLKFCYARVYTEVYASTRLAEAVLLRWLYRYRHRCGGRGTDDAGGCGFGRGAAGPLACAIPGGSRAG